MGFSCVLGTLTTMEISFVESDLASLPLSRLLDRVKLNQAFPCPHSQFTLHPPTSLYPPGYPFSVSACVCLYYFFNVFPSSSLTFFTSHSLLFVSLFSFSNLLLSLFTVLLSPTFPLTPTLALSSTRPITPTDYHSSTYLLLLPPTSTLPLTPSYSPPTHTYSSPLLSPTSSVQ